MAGGDVMQAHGWPFFCRFEGGCQVDVWQEGCGGVVWSALWVEVSSWRTSFVGLFPTAWWNCVINLWLVSWLPWCQLGRTEWLAICVLSLESVLVFWQCVVFQVLWSEWTRKKWGREECGAWEDLVSVDMCCEKKNGCFYALIHDEKKDRDKW